jgi:hypothetical protein
MVSFLIVVLLNPVFQFVLLKLNLGYLLVLILHWFLQFFNFWIVLDALSIGKRSHVAHHWRGAVLFLIILCLCFFFKNFLLSSYDIPGLTRNVFQFIWVFSAQNLGHINVNFWTLRETNNRQFQAECKELISKWKPNFSLFFVHIVS